MHAASCRSFEGGQRPLSSCGQRRSASEGRRRALFRKEPWGVPCGNLVGERLPMMPLSVKLREATTASVRKEKKRPQKLTAVLPALPRRYIYIEMCRT